MYCREWILWRNDNLAHRQWHLTVGQFGASRGIWFAVNFNLAVLEFSCLFQIGKEALIHQALAPYMRMGKTQDSTRLCDESEFNKPCKAPKSPLAKKALCALQIRSSTDIRLVELEHHHTPRHLTDSTTGRPATESGESIPSLPAITMPHTSQYSTSGHFYKQKRQQF